MILILVLFSSTLIFIICHFDFPAVCLFFIFRAAGLYAYCTENSLFCRCFPEGGGGLPYLALTVIYNVPLSRAWFLGSWTGILYKNVKVGYKHSTFVVWTMFYQNLQFHDVSFKNYLVPCMRNETKRISVGVWRHRRQNCTQTILEYCWCPWIVIYWKTVLWIVIACMKCMHSVKPELQKSSVTYTVHSLKINRRN